MNQNLTRKGKWLVMATAWLFACPLPAQSRIESPTEASQETRPGVVKLTRNARDESASDLECYKIETPNATFFLDRVGAGLSSMLDRDGHDWIGFRPESGSGSAGEYRGFPNAVFREAGSYFHPRNRGTDPCVTEVVLETPQRISITATSENKKWAGRFDFDSGGCTFTLTRRPEGHHFWVLYEGTPGGSYDDDDWWMTSGSEEKRPLTTPHERDLPAPEWIAFGDRRMDRSLILHHLQDDAAPDYFYQMNRQMTVFGFGRRKMEKHLQESPQSFFIGFVESSEHSVVTEFIDRRVLARSSQTSGDR